MATKQRHNLAGFNVGPTQWANFFGVEFPAGTDRIFAALTVAKKWELFKERGDVITSPPGDCFEEAMHALLPSIRMSSWTQQMLHDFVDHSYSAFIGCGACGKSFAMSAAALGFRISDPLTTTVIMGSATLADLRTRCWSPLLRLFHELKGNARFDIPGKSAQAVYAIVNEKDESIAETMSPLAGIHGRALDEGRIFGIHNEFVAIFVDEMGLVNDIDTLKTAFSNIRIGTKVFKCCSAANPLPWSAPQSQFYLPKPGETVTPDTGSWTSRMGYFVRHFDGTKSPVVLDPSLKRQYPFLMSREDVASTLDMCGGDEKHPTFYKMVRGFPLDGGASSPTVLDPLVAAANRVAEAPEPPVYGERRSIGLAAGVDPSWSANGDTASYAGVHVFEQEGRVILDFTGRTSRLPIIANSPVPVTRQLRDGVVKRMQSDGGPDIANMYVDSSGNQNLSDFLDVYIAPGCGHINNSARASDKPVRNLDSRPAREHIKDRGTEAWITLSAFCQAGMVRGLPQAALEGLTTRRFALRPNSSEPCMPMRLEPKEEFVKRLRGHSPDDTDACALAALAVKERLGVIPFGKAPVPTQSSLFPASRMDESASPVDPEVHESLYEDDLSEVGAYDSD
jgi:hypothetical protein